MAQRYYSENYRPKGPVRRRRGAGRRLAAIGLMAAVAFAGGFFLLWTLGSWIVGGSGADSGSSGGVAAAAAAVASGQTDYTIEPLVDLSAFRDLSYVPVKGLYMTGYSAGSATAVDRLVGLADRTEINAFVINVKDDDGYITYETDAQMAKALGTGRDIIADIDGLLAKLAEHNIIPIARVVCFKDDVLPKTRPELGVQDKNNPGQLWKDNSKYHHTFLNPYNHEVWEYLVEIAEDAARRGFREIQFDYVRFPETNQDSALYPGEYCTKDEAIAGFLAYARPRLEKLGVWVSADVFGLVIAHPTNSGIGQDLYKMSRNIDILSPMPYPSHYSANSYAIPNPNAKPGELMTAAMKEAAQRLAGTGTECRPWLQDFSSAGMAGGPFIKYTAELVKAQIRAAEEQGFDEWLLWNASNKYTEAALRPQ
jgi:hypothetical protein